MVYCDYPEAWPGLLEAVYGHLTSQVRRGESRGLGGTQHAFGWQSTHLQLRGFCCSQHPPASLPRRLRWSEPLLPRRPPTPGRAEGVWRPHGAAVSGPQIRVPGRGEAAGLVGGRDLAIGQTRQQAAVTVQQGLNVLRCVWAARAPPAALFLHPASILNTQDPIAPTHNHDARRSARPSRRLSTPPFPRCCPSCTASWPTPRPARPWA